MKQNDDPPSRLGRPARKTGEATGMIGVRVTASERAAYEAAAEAKGMALAEWIRHACAKLLGRTPR